ALRTNLHTLQALDQQWQLFLERLPSIEVARPTTPAALRPGKMLAQPTTRHATKDQFLHGVLHQIVHTEDDPGPVAPGCLEAGLVVGHSGQATKQSSRMLYQAPEDADHRTIQVAVHLSH